jgi:hypothetical protein
MRALLISATILFLTGCTRAEEEVLGRLQKIEVFYRPAPPGKQEADLFLYRLMCDKRTLVCHHWSGIETPEQEVHRLEESIKKWRQLSASRGTSPLALLAATDFAYKGGRVYGGETRLVFYPDSRNIVSMKSVDFSWEKFPWGGAFEKIATDMEVRSTDKQIASLEIGSEARLQKTVEVGTKDAATGP